MLADLVGEAARLVVERAVDPVVKVAVAAFVLGASLAVLEELLEELVVCIRAQEEEQRVAWTVLRRVCERHHLLQHTEELLVLRLDAGAVEAQVNDLEGHAHVRLLALAEAVLVDHVHHIFVELLAASDIHRVVGVVVEQLVAGLLQCVEDAVQRLGADLAPLEAH